MRSATTAVFVLVVCVHVCPAFAQPPAPFVSLTLNPSGQTVNLGEMAGVTIGISGLADRMPPALAIFEFGLGFDPTILSINHVDFGDQVAGIDFLAPFGPAGSTTMSDNTTPDILILHELSVEPPPVLVDMQPDAFNLATVTFNAIGPGTSPLVLGAVILADEQHNPLLPDPIFVPAEITVASPIPAPGSLLLGMAGVGLFVRLRRGKVL